MADSQSLCASVSGIVGSPCSLCLCEVCLQGCTALHCIVVYCVVVCGVRVIFWLTRFAQVCHQFAEMGIPSPRPKLLFGNLLQYWREVQAFKTTCEDVCYNLNYREK